MQDTQEQKGFSIVEILISLAIGLIVLAALASTFIAQNKAYNVQEQVTGMLQAARAGMDIMGREIIMAGFDPAEEMQLTDPDASKFVGIPLPASNPASVIEIYADLNGDEDTADPNEHIIYAFANGQLTRKTGSGAPQPFIDNVEDFKVEYWKADGTTKATSTEDIRQVRVTLTVGTGRADVDYPRTRTLTSSFIPRNLNNTTTTTSSASSTTMIVTSTTEEVTTTTEEVTTTTDAETPTTVASTTTTTLAPTTTLATTTTIESGGPGVGDIDPPTVKVNPNQTVEVCAEVTPDGTATIVSVELCYSVSGVVQTPVVMTLSGGGYCGSIPGQKKDTLVAYYVKATDNYDNVGLSNTVSFTVGATP